MPASPADSALYSGLFGDAETAALFSDSAEIRAMMLVEAALARAQASVGMIPAEAAAAITRASHEGQIDPSALAAATAVNGVPVPGFVARFRTQIGDPALASWLHWGATSQDIMDTGLALRLRRLIAIWDARLAALIAALGQLAGANADLPMVARTYGQAATPTTFGAFVAAWGQPLIRHRARLASILDDISVASLAGAAGTLSAMGAEGANVRAAFAKELGLRDPETSRHAERDSIAAFAAAMAGLCASLGKLGEDLILLAQSGIDEVSIAGAGGSSTMPQKQNPVGPSVLSAIARQAVALSSVMQGAVIHRQQRDGAAWFTEWMTLPQLAILTGRALALAGDLAQKISPNPGAMLRNLDAGGGLIRAEALTFALARQIPRPEAQAKITALCQEVMAGGEALPVLFARDFPALALPPLDTGLAAQEARAFARAAASA